MEPVKQKQKRSKKSEQSPRDMREAIKWTSIHIVGVPEGKEREKGKDIMAKISTNLFKDMNINIQEAQQTPGKMNSATHTETHCNQNFKNKDRILEAAREK